MGFPDTTSSTSGVIAYFLDSYDMVRYDVHSPWATLDSLYEISYDDNGSNPVTSTTKYNYSNNHHLQVTSSETVNSKNESIKTYNTYPDDYEGISGLPYSAMMIKNIITPVIESRTTNNTTELAKVKTNYADWGNGVYEVANIENSVKGNALESMGTINKYDARGNILEYTTKNGIVSSIIWGYKNTYPVAKIVNATYNQAKAQLTMDTSLIQDLDGTTLLTELNHIRTGLTNAQVTTYTYKPLIGLATITDANSKTNTYLYDVFNRLVLIKDQDNNAVKKLEYAYNGSSINNGFVLYYNNAISRSYTCHNCISEATASSVTYTVPAGKWFSVVSQASADAKAAADTLANGQLYADRNGHCTTYCTTCNSTTCTGVNKKCVYGVCETGIRINTSAVKNKFTNEWTCTYHYEWSDGSYSEDYTEITESPCGLT